jgi:Peptidase propeptide and YPEB domain
MLRSKLIPAVMAAVIAVGTSGVAFAAMNGKGEDAGEIQAALSAKVTAGQAIAAAEKNTGGRALEVGLEDENGGVLYEVKTITQDKVVAFIDPATGQVIRTKEEGLISAFGTILGGASGFFTSRLPAPFAYPGSAEVLSFDDVAPMRAALERVVDFDRINAGTDHVNLRHPRTKPARPSSEGALLLNTRRLQR